MENVVIDDRTSELRPVDRGLRSIQGIHWLSLVGALVSAVSIYRLVAAHWQLLPVAAQFSLLTVAGLGVFAAGDLLRHRLLLRQAGTAVLGLFGVVLPLLAWGADEMGLLAAPAGVPVFAAAMTGLVLAARRGLRRGLGYPGTLGVAALTVLLVMPAVTAHVVRAAAVAPSELLVAMALVLGAVFLMASVHLNRFAFHRDRRDDRDRPLALLPFALLATLYAAALVPFGLQGSGVGLPLMVLAVGLVATGEEYYRAVSAACGSIPVAWPRRSVALLAIGFGCAVVALLVSLLDTSFVTAATASLLGAGLFLTWSVRYQQRWAHALGLLTAFFAYHELPLVFRDLAILVADRFSAAIGVGQTSPALWSFGHVPFLIGLFGLGRLLLRRRVRADLLELHTHCTALHALFLVLVAVTDLTAAVRFLPLGLSLALIGVVALRSSALVLPAHAALSLGVLCWTVELTRARELADAQPLLALSAVLTVLAIASPQLQRWIGGIAGDGAPGWRSLFLWPTAATGLVASGFALAGMVGDLDRGYGLILASLATLAAGHRLAKRRVLVPGVLLLSIGLNVMSVDVLGGSAVRNPTPMLLLAAWVAIERLADRSSSAAARPWSAAGLTGVWLHAALGVSAYIGVDAMVVAPYPPLVLGLLGLRWLDIGLGRSSHRNLALGVAALVGYAPLQLHGLGWITTATAGVGVAGLVLLAGQAALRRRPHRPLQAAVDPVGRLWMAVALLTVLITSGTAALALAGLLTLVASLRPVDGESAAGSRDVAVPFALGLVTLVHLAVALLGAPAGWLIEDIVALGFDLLPPLALFGLVWLLLVEHLVDQPSDVLRELGRLVEGAIGGALFGAFLADASLSGASHMLLITVALAMAGRHVCQARASSFTLHGWAVQAWCGLALLDGVTAGWISFGHGRTPYVLLAVALGEHVVGRWLDRAPGRGALAGPCHRVAGLLPMLAGLVSVSRTVDSMAIGPVWFKSLPTFLVSLLYLVRAGTPARPGDRHREWSIGAAASFLSAGVLAVVIAAPGLGTEVGLLAPGLGLLLLASQLRRELGPEWFGRLFAAGATFVYATPIHALSQHLTWGWQATLAVLCIGFGASSFQLRSRSLLVVSTCALLVDLGFFVAKVYSAAPLLLWVAGLAFGLGLMGFAAYLEHRREGIKQQLRVFGAELQGWQP